MPERLVKRGKELSVEEQNFANVIWFSTFINVDVDSVAFPPAEQLDVVLRDAVHIGGNSGALSKRMTRVPEGRNAHIEKKVVH
jgi:hypothetical protein